MMLIGIDPHKASHTAVVIDDSERELARVRITANKSQVAALLEFAESYQPRRWAIESAGGLGFLLAQQLVRAGEDVVDVPATLAARVRLLGSGRGSKNDPNDALSTAIAALRDPQLRTVLIEDHAMVLRLLADRHQDLTSLRTQAVCRLHACSRRWPQVGCNADGLLLQPLPGCVASTPRTPSKPNARRWRWGSSLTSAAWTRTSPR